MYRCNLKIIHYYYDYDKEWAVQLDTHRPAHEGARILVNLGYFQQKEERVYGGITMKEDGGLSIQFDNGDDDALI